MLRGVQDDSLVIDCENMVVHLFEKRYYMLDNCRDINSLSGGNLNMLDCPHTVQFRFN